MEMKIVNLPDAVRFERMNTAEIRESFLVDTLFVPGQINLVYSIQERMIVGSIVPTNQKILLGTYKELASEYFTERREIGLINIGDVGAIFVDGNKFVLEHKEALYIGRGAKKVEFVSENVSKPAQFYLVSLPAHTTYPTAKIGLKSAEPVHLGDEKNSNKRTIYKYIHEKGVKSCQLVMGMTELADGSIWNTMPAHTHIRRTEVYMYFGLDKDAVVFHYMGKPSETRHIVVRNGQAVISPIWSIHCGAGTKNYSFVWAMGGENQNYADMDVVPMDELK